MDVDAERLGGDVLLRHVGVDPRVDPQRPDLVARALVPDYALGPHGAPLGLTFANGAKLGPHVLAQFQIKEIGRAHV